jgi:hypothetical protein
MVLKIVLQNVSDFALIIIIFLVVLEFELKALTTSQALYHLSHAPAPALFAFILDRVFYAWPA